MDRSRRVICWFARFKAVELSSILMESYLYVAGGVSHTTYIIVQLQLVFNQFFSFFVFFLQTRQKFFHKRGTNHEQIEEIHL